MTPRIRTNHCPIRNRLFGNRPRGYGIGRFVRGFEIRRQEFGEEQGREESDLACAVDFVQGEGGEGHDGEGIAGGEDYVVEFLARVVGDGVLEESFEFGFEGGGVGEVDGEAVDAFCCGGVGGFE